MDLNGKRALVTGGSVRLGRCICEALAARGCGVVVHYRRSAAEAVALVARLAATGVPASCVQGDLTDEPACQRVMAAAAAEGGVDILINNASVFNKDAFMDVGEVRLRDELAVNAFAPMFLTRAFARQCGAAAPGGSPVAKVVNLLDRRVAGLEKGMLPYLLSKRMLLDYTRIAALELGPRISVNAVAPGPVLAPPGKGDAYLHDHAGPMVLGRRPLPADVAAAVLYLLEADSVTGQVIYVDAGQHLL